MEQMEPDIESRIFPALDLTPIGVLAHELGATPATYAQVEREILAAAVKLDLWFWRIAGCIFVDRPTGERIAVLVRVNRAAGFAPTPEPAAAEVSAGNN